MLEPGLSKMTVTTNRPNSEAFQIDVHNLCHVATLPRSVRRKWRNSEPIKDGNKDTTHADLDFRLQKAEERRAEFRKWWSRKRPRSEAIQVRFQMQRELQAKRLEQKLADAEANRRSCLESVRSKAAATRQRSELVAERFNERQVLLAQKLSDALDAAENRRLALLEAEKERLSALHEHISSRKDQVKEKKEEERVATHKQLRARLTQADRVRLAKLAATAAKAGEKVRHAKDVSKMRRLNDEKDAQQKRSYLTIKLQTAEQRRYEDCTVRIVINAEKSETQFLKRQATKREKLRRSGTSRCVRKFWRSFRDSNHTTKELAERFLNIGVTFLELPEEPEESPLEEDSDATLSAREWKDPFEEFASRLQSQQTINSAKDFLARMKDKFLGKCEGVHDCTPLLKRLFKKTPKSKLERYPTRIFLCAYMILNHPEVVFNAKGERESALSAASKEMVEAFERMLQRCLQTKNKHNETEGNQGESSEIKSLSDLFNSFDDCWVAYLEQFVAWKSHDARDLANSLIRMAAKMQLSMLKKVDGDVSSERVRNNPDLMNIVRQVQHDHCLLRERVERLTGKSGIEKFDKAISDAHDDYEESVSESQGWSTEVSTGDRQYNKESERELVVSSSEQSFTGQGSKRQPPRRSNTSHNGSEDSVNANSKNEAFVWELLHNCSFQLPSTTIDAIWASALKETIQLETYTLTNEDAKSPSEALQKQINIIAEKAFWDMIEERLSVEGAGAIQACTTLVDIGSELAKSLPDNASSRILRDHLKDENDLLRLLQGNETTSGLDTTRLLYLMDHTSDLLREFGSEIRSESSIDGQSKIKQKIEAALEVEVESERRIALAKAIAHALRLLYAQLKVLRFDMANARIRALSRSLTGPQAIEYTRKKFFESYPLMEGQSSMENLPRLKHWVEQTVESQRSVILAVQPFVSQYSNSIKSHVPSSMHSGTYGAASSSSSTSQGITQWPEVQFSSPVVLEGWRASVRLGLVNLISAPLPLTADNIPETFVLDIARLHKIQNLFQRLVVISASLLAVKQARQDSKRALDAEELSSMKSRLTCILDSPSLNVCSLTAELGKMAGATELEPLIDSTLMNLINREKGGFKALNNSLTKALGAYLIMADSSSSSSSSHSTSHSSDLTLSKKAVDSFLSKIDSSFLLDDVIAVAKDLSIISGISEAVYPEIYEAAFHQ